MWIITYMGVTMISNFNVSKTSQREFGNMMGSSGTFAESAMDWIKENPVAAEAITNAVSVVFPPARAIKTAIDITNQVRPLLEGGEGGEGSDFEQVNQGWREEGGGIADKANKAKQTVKTAQGISQLAKSVPL